MSNLLIVTDSYQGGSFSITGVVSNYDVKANQAAMFPGTLAKYATLQIRTDIACTLKFNATANAGIPLNANETRTFLVNYTNLFITTTATTAVQLFMT